MWLTTDQFGPTPGIVRECASNASGKFSSKCGRFYGKERVRKWGFMSWVWKAVDLSRKCEFIHRLLIDPNIVDGSTEFKLIHI